MRKRLLIPAIAMLALLAAAIPVFAQDAAEDAPSPSASVELRVWQSVRSPIDFWVSATIGGGVNGAPPAWTWSSPWAAVGARAT